MYKCISINNNRLCMYILYFIHTQSNNYAVFLAMNRTVCHVLTLEQKSAGNFIVVANHNYLNIFLL